jgi:hypothetical protein
MKKVLLALLMVVFVSGICFAEAKEVSGKIETVTNGKIEIIDDMGTLVALTATSATKVVGDAANILTLDQLKKGEKVKVKYEENAGAKEAKDVNVVK